MERPAPKMFATAIASLPRRTAVAAFFAAASALLLGAAPPQPAGPRWSTTVTESGIGAYSVGNPQAKVKLVEYFSYTCSHCAEFANEAGVPLKTHYIDTGLVLFEYRNLIRDPLDMTAAMLARCGGPKAFAPNHQAIFAAQPAWLGKAAKMTQAQQAAWYRGTLGERTRRMAADTGLDALMRGRGYTPAQLNACLESGVAEAELMGMTAIGTNVDKVEGTPTFFVNGRKVEVGHWADLKPILDAALKQK